MPTTNETITAPPQFRMLLRIARVKSTLVRSVPRWLTTVPKFSSVGVKTK